MLILNACSEVLTCAFFRVAVGSGADLGGRGGGGGGGGSVGSGPPLSYMNNGAMHTAIYATKVVYC